MTTERNKLTVYLALISTILMWSSAFAGIRIGMREFGPGSFALLRLGIAAICMLFIYQVKAPKTKLQRKEIVEAILLGVIGMGLYHTFLNLGEKTVPAGLASFVVSQVPIVTTLVGFLFLKEKLNRRVFLGLVLGCLGTLIIAFGDLKNTNYDLGVVYIMASVCASCFYVIRAQHLLKRMSVLQASSFMIFGGAISSLIFLPQLIRQIQYASQEVILAGLYLGIFPTSLATLTQNYAIARVSRTTAVSCYYAIPLITSFIAWLWLKEVPTLVPFLGGLISLVGAVLMNFK